jgi:predicted DNA-binding transcriptional regulator AlpA
VSDTPIYYSQDEVCRIARNVSRQTIYNWEKKGLFPNRRQLGPNAIGWLKSEVDDWATNRPTPRTREV